LEKYTFEKYTLAAKIFFIKATVAKKHHGAMEIHLYHFAKYTFGKIHF
jgi:hypothetical protein